MKINKKLFKSFSIYSGSNLLNSLIPFLLLPILTRYLSAEEYGIVSMFQLLTFFTLPIMSVSGAAAVTRKYYEINDTAFKKYFFNSIIINLFNLILLFLCCYFCETWISRLTGFPRYWLYAVILYSLFFNIAELLLSLWRVHNNEFFYGLFRILRTLLDLVISLFFIISINLTWQGRILGQLISIVLFGVLALFILYKTNYLKWEIDKIDIKDILIYGFPLVFHSVGSFFIGFVDKLFIINLYGLSAMGVYSVGFQIGMVISLIQNSFNLAWVPWLFAQLKDGSFNKKKKIVRFTYLYFIFMIICALVLFYTKDLIFSILGKDFNGASQFVLWIALAFAFNGMYKMIVNYLFYSKDTKIIAVMTIITALLNVGLNYVLINKFGIIGAAQATCIAFFIQFILVFFISVRKFPMPWFSSIKIV